MSRPQVRSKSGEEASLPHFKAFREEDPLPERVLNQILVGVSTRNYESSLDKPAAKLKSRGTSKSAASRHLVSQTTKKLEQYLSRRLEEYELAAVPSINSSCVRLASCLQPGCLGRLHVGRFEDRRRLYSGV